MVFNSIEFTIFLPLVFILYWSVGNNNFKLQNILLTVSSFVFYGWWDWRFLCLLILSSVVDYTIGYLLYFQEKVIIRKILLFISLFVNLSILAFFKYYNFFIDSLYDLFPGLKPAIGFDTLKIILPVGISFYTFQTLSYTIDVYKRIFIPEKNIISFCAFVCFFPQLVAGPIERATNLLPQFSHRRHFNYKNAVNGMRQILWGLFKKIVIADNCAKYANQIFNNSDNFAGVILILGAVFFAFQIYGDFSGYSDIAIGSARLLGFELMKNFAFPYFSRDIAEFWRRWHISLSTWFRDYIYIPLGGSKCSTIIKIRNTLIIFILSGLWHGANWTCIFWGLLNAVYFLPLLVTHRNRKNIDVVAKGKILASLRDTLAILSTFVLTTFAWIFFRAESVWHAFKYIKGIFCNSFFDSNHFFSQNDLVINIILICLFVFIEWCGREHEYAIEKLFLSWPKKYRYAVY